VLVKKFFNVGFEALAVQDRRPFGLDRLTRYPLFTPEFLAFLRRMVPAEGHAELVSAVVVTARRPWLADVARERPPGVPEAAALLDLGERGCDVGATLQVRRLVGTLEPGQVLEVRTTDPGVREDIPAWCRMTGHEFLGAAGHRYFVRKRR
jgi:tRNA 2-thiouridine synthesizing protein A